MAIPTKAKNIYLLPVTDGGITQYFNMPGFATYDEKKAKHNGLDIGWTRGESGTGNHAYWPIIACQDGTVVATYNNNSSFGNAVVLQHDFEDGTHSWTSYIHLKDKPTVKVGQKIKQAEQIGIRGGSPYVNGKAKYGVHLHLYLTKATKAKYTWDTMKANVIDPLPMLYRSKKLKYNILVNDIAKLPYLEDVIPQVVSPVERNETVNQLLEKSSNLRVRMTPSLKGTIIGHLKPNVYYNYYDTVKADGYEWYKIADNQWCAKTSTMIVYPGKTELQLAQEKIEKLKEENETLTTKVDSLQSEIDNNQTKLAELEDQKSLIEKARDLLQQKINEAVELLISK